MAEQLSPNMGPEWPVEVVTQEEFAEVRATFENEIWNLRNTMQDPSFEQMLTELDILSIALDQRITALEEAIINLTGGDQNAND